MHSNPTTPSPFADRELAISVLGPLRVELDGEDLTPSGPLQRALLEALVLGGGRAVSTDALAEALWGDQLPADHLAALQTQMFRLRKRLPQLLITRGHGGYTLDVASRGIDSDQFEQLAAEIFADPDGDVARIETALGLWRGDPYSSLDTDAAQAARTRLEELRLRLIDEQFERRVGDPDHELIADLEHASVMHPTRERPHLQLVRALMRQHRAVDALRVYDRFRRTLGEELGIEPSPELRAEHEAIVRGALAGSGTAEMNSAPLYATSLVGRNEDVQRLATLARSTRLVTLVGVGGVGKTRLAADLTWSLASEFRDGVAWCDLAASSASDVIAAIHAQVGIEQFNDSSPTENISRQLAHRHMLLVLDNCEHVIEVVAEVAGAVLASSATVHMLATSRERLAVDGEFVFTVEPLGSIDADSSSTNAPPAIELFVARAAAAGAEIDLVADRDALTHLCGRLGGLPLGIELAAAQLFTMDLATITREIDRSLQVLSGQRRTVGRHRSLTATITWSYELLPPGDRDSFVALSVFRSAFDIEAASAILQTESGEVARQLRNLAERSLLQRTGRRWLMLEPLRQFAHEQPLATSHDVEGTSGVLIDARIMKARARHADYFVSRAERLGTAVEGHDPAGAMDSIDRDLAEFRAAYAHLVATGDADAIFRLVYALERYSMSRPRRETMAWAGAAADLAPTDRRTPDMLSFVAYAAWGRGDSEEFARAAKQAVLVAEAIRPGEPLTAHVADAIGLYHLTTGDLETAVAYLEHALSQVPRSEHLRRSETNGTVVLALAYLGSAEAPARADELLAEFSSGAGALASAWAWYGAGEALVEIDPPTAIFRLQLALDQAQRCGAWFVAGVAGASLASLEVRHGDADRATELYRLLLPLWSRTADSSVVWTAMRSVSALFHRLELHDHAATVLGAVLHTNDGHEVFGVDAERLSNLEHELLGVLGQRAFEAAALAGRGLDAVELSEFVLARLPRESASSS
jgi:predicted ATPase/DNA-binding SARP family transcriptional activator